METFLSSLEVVASLFFSVVFTAMESALFLLFVDVFGTRRIHGKTYGVIAALFALLAFLWSNSYLYLVGPSFTWKMVVVIALCYLFCSALYREPAPLYRLFFVVLWYLMHYLYSIILTTLPAFLLGISYQEFRDFRYAGYYILASAVCFGSEWCLTLAFRKFYRRRGQALHPRQLILYFVFPAASLMSLAAFLQLLKGMEVSQWFVLACCGALLLANAAVFYLLHRMEQAAQSQKKLVALGQQLQMQAANMESARGLYEAQRKATHDFRAQLEVLGQLLRNQEYDAARKYLESVSGRQSDRLVLVDCHHPILNALFNIKAEAAAQKQIEIRFAVNDLSALPFDQADLTVLLANLLDNAIEACEKCAQPRTIEVRALKEESFFFSVHNTSLPVAIQDGHIPTTKPDPRLHGFGLPNVKAIVEKYHGTCAMQYADGWFQFAGEMPIS